VIFDPLTPTTLDTLGTLSVSDTPATNAIPFSALPRGVEGLRAPFPVNAWWSTLIIDNVKSYADAPLDDTRKWFTCHPWQYASQRQGLSINKPILVNEDEQVTMRQSELSVGVGAGETLVTDHNILRYDSLTVTLQYSQLNNRSNHIQTTIFQGSPFTTFTYTRLTVHLAFSKRISNINGECPVGEGYTVRSDVFTLRFVDSSEIYLVLLQKEVTMRVDDKTLFGDQEFSGWLRVSSKFDSQSSVCELINNRNAIVTAGNVTLESTIVPIGSRN